MGYPTSNAYRPVNPVLQGILGSLANSSKRLIADSLLETIADGSKARPGQENYHSGTIQVVSPDAFFGDPTQDNARAPGSTYARDPGVQLAPITYSCQEYGRETVLDLVEEARAQLPGAAGLKQVLLKSVVDALQLEKERRYAELFLTTANWSGSATPANKWDVAASDPIADINTAVEAIRDYGADGDTIIFGRAAARLLRVNSAFLEYLPTTANRQYITDETISELMMSHFGLKAYFGNARYKTSTDSPGDSTPTLADVWGDSVWVGSLRGSGSPAGGRGGLMASGMAAARIVEKGWELREYERPEISSVVMQSRYIQTEKIIQAQLGYVIDDVET